MKTSFISQTNFDLAPVAVVGRGMAMLVAIALLSACTKFEYHETKNVSANRLSEQANLAIAEDALLDVGIAVFDPGLDNLDDDEIAYANVRQSEAVWFSSQLKAVLEYSNIWGAVRTMPNNNSVVDVLVTGQILDSNGEFVKLSITAVDATGSTWFSKEYQQQASAYAYNPEVNNQRDPFRSLFAQVANDLFDYRVALEQSQAMNIRNVSKLRFASDFVPELYEDFLIEEDGQFSLVRVPAENDPMIQRVDRIRARNELFLDVIQDYYRVFNRNMAHPYQEWRKANYKEALYARQLQEQARNEKLAGAAAILLGILAQGSGNRYTRAGGHVGIFAGADLIYQGYAKQNEALIHSATIRELGAALEQELEPSVIDLEDRSVTLSGTVDDQFQEWRRILSDLFKAEQGISTQQDISSVDPTLGAANPEELAPESVEADQLQAE